MHNFLAEKNSSFNCELSVMAFALSACLCEIIGAQLSAFLAALLLWLWKKLHGDLHVMLPFLRSLSLSPEGDNPCPAEKEMEEIGEKLSSPVFCPWKFIFVFFFCPKERRKEIADSLI